MFLDLCALKFLGLKNWKKTIKISFNRNWRVVFQDQKKIRKYFIVLDFSKK